MLRAILVLCDWPFCIYCLDYTSLFVILCPCYAFNSAEVWCIQLNDSVIDIAHLPEGKVFAALADGSIAVLQVHDHV